MQIEAEENVREAVGALMRAEQVATSYTYYTYYTYCTYCTYCTHYTHACRAGGDNGEECGTPSRADGPVGSEHSAESTAGTVSVGAPRSTDGPVGSEHSAESTAGTVNVGAPRSIVGAAGGATYYTVYADYTYYTYHTCHVRWVQQEESEVRAQLILQQQRREEQMEISREAAGLAPASEAPGAQMCRLYISGGLVGRLIARLTNCLVA